VSRTANAPLLADALLVAAVAWEHFRAGTSLDRALDLALRAEPPSAHPRLGAAARDLLYTATRHRALIDAIVGRLAARAPSAAVGAIAAVALGQLLAARHADYAVVDQAVNASKSDPATAGASGFINALLRRWLREREVLRAELEREDEVRCNLPRWWIEQVRAAHPRQADAVFTLQRLPPPLVLRVNRRRTSVAAYLERLRGDGVDATQVGAWAVWLPTPCPVDAIAGFAQGEVSVQDAGAQLAADWLGVQDGMSVLDACAAPGGKTAQLAEIADIELDALEIDPQRAALIESNLARTGARDHARVRVRVADAADAADARATVPAGGYDRILLDAPCTASGIVRRHPDVPWLRRASDVAQLATVQARLMDALWPLLSPAGRLLYVVCSVFPEEGPRQAQRFAQRWPDARAVPLLAPEEVPDAADAARVQLLPAQGVEPYRGGLPAMHDGFFYAMFEKS
jgi:16S rRNA (cytosine967-C5)-methyltransferase